VDPYTLLTKSEVEQIVGKRKPNSTSETEGDARWCHYPFVNNKDVMEVRLFPVDGIERTRKLAENPTILKGVGQKAFWCASSMELTASICS